MLFKITKDQQVAIRRVAERWGRNYRDMRKGVCATFGMDEAVCLTPNNGALWLVIERDGYTHS